MVFGMVCSSEHSPSQRRDGGASTQDRPAQDRPATITPYGNFRAIQRSVASAGPSELEVVVLTPQALISRQLPTHTRRREHRSSENNFTAVDQVRDVGRFSNKIAPAPDGTRLDHSRFDLTSFD